jgi:hypothetical protein
VPESALPADLYARLSGGEGGAPHPPPWSTRVQAVLWWHRATPTASAVLPEAMRGLPTWGLTVAAAVRYLDTPVGAYSELFASPLLLRPGSSGALPAITVPFIAVDSLTSVVGGRAGWALPKTIAEADWSGPGQVQLSGSSAVGDPWSVAVETGSGGPPLPLAGFLPLVQPHPDGRRLRAMVRLVGRARPVRVQVEASGPTLGDWLRTGTHPGIRVESGRMSITAPRPV